MDISYKIKDKISQDLIKIIDYFLDFLSVEKKYSKHTIEAYKTDIFYFLYFLYSAKNIIIDLSIINSINKYDFRSWLFEKSKNHQNSSNARSIASLRSFFLFLKKENLTKNEEIFRIKTPKNIKPLPKPIDLIDIEKITSAIFDQKKEMWQKKRDIALLTLIYGCGLRISEALLVSQSSLENQQNLVIQGKGKKERSLPLLPIVINKIKEYINSCPFEINQNQPIFLDNKGNKYSRFSFNLLIKNIRRKLNLSEKITPHSFRHSFATHLLESGADLRSIQELLGHTNLSTTQKYTKIEKSRILTSYEKFKLR